MFAFSFFVCYYTGDIRTGGIRLGRRASTEPSKKQQEILVYIKDFIRDMGYPPSIREICLAVGLTSSSTVFTHLEALERKGLITRGNGTTRSIRIVEDADQEFRYDSPETDEVAVGDVREQNEDFNEIPNDEVIYVPVIGKVAAGMPLLAVENTERTFPVPIDFTKGKEVFMLKVKGESMIEAGILDGDYVLVTRQATAQDGEIIVALVEDGATVKTFYKEKTCFRLQPENRTMKAIYVDELTILGKVTGVFRMM